MLYSEKYKKYFKIRIKNKDLFNLKIKLSLKIGVKLQFK